MTERFTPPAMLDVIGRLAPQTAREVRQFWSASVSDFAAHHAVPRTSPQCAIALRSFEILATALDEALETHSGPSAPSAMLRDRPLIQSGPHCELPVDRHSFFAFWFFTMATRIASVPASLAFTTSNVTLEKRSRFGPGWLTAGEHSINLFGLTRKLLSSASANTPIAGLTLDVTALENAISASPDAEWATFLRLLSGVSDQACLYRPRDFLLKSIDRLWTLSSASPSLSCFDEDVTARAIELHLGWVDSPVSQLLLDPSRHEAFLRARDRAIREDVGGFMRWSTDLFWGIRKNRLRPLRVVGGRLVECVDTQGIDVPLTDTAIAENLRNGVLRPDLFLSMAVLSILPRVTVLGGPRQLGYYAFVENVWLETLEMSNTRESSLRQEIAAVSCCAWGMCIVDRTIDAASAFATAHRLESWSGIDYGRVTLAEACLALQVFREHPKWLALAVT